MTHTFLTDQGAREMALDASQSFIVQAPAGSGKTELLIQRLLTVLATADSPSEVLAITFTNKAAGEMRERLHSALLSASGPESPDSSALVTQRRALALRVLERDRALGWRLLDGLNGVMIDTFDAFCTRITGGAPVLSVAAASALASVSESVGPLYRQAAQDALFDDDPEVVAASRTLLGLAANRVDDVIDLIANLLGRRAQWLGEAVDTTDAGVAQINSRLQTEIDAELARIAEQFNPLHRADIGAMLAFTAETYSTIGKIEIAAERTAAVNDWTSGAQSFDVTTWKCVADLLLTGSRELRKSGGVNKSSGFPLGTDAEFSNLTRAERDDAKARMKALLDELNNESAWISTLAKVDHLPTQAAIAEHAATLQATLIILKRAAAHLSILLREQNVTDFAGVASAALQVLQEERESVLGALDARLRHVLVDEVQDTNPAQFALLTAITSDWSPGDGRTLFLVGDPMQSIYGFRDADVALFALAQTQGIGDIRLTPLTLSANYRSQPGVVDWVNDQLSRVFAKVRAWETAPVTFTAAVATQAVVNIASQIVEQQAFADAESEGRHVADAIDSIRREHPSESIAILVRTRPHAQATIAALTAQGVPFTAREFARWEQRETIRDLLSLTFALAHPSDRTAFFSVLRAPWVGLTLATLTALAHYLDNAGRDALPWHALAADAPWISQIDTEEAPRVAHAFAAFSTAQARAWLSPLAEQVRAVWQQLGGPSWCTDDDALDDAETFFAWLHENAPGGLLPPRHVVRDLLARQHRSFAAASDADESGNTSAGTVEILTIHKAKGLEWDHVFLVGIDRKQRGDARELARWRFVPTEDGSGERRVLVAARDSRKKLVGSVFDYVSQHTNAARAAEAKRLLYVAATRAKITLTLTRCNAASEPPGDSFSWLLDDVADSRFEVPERSGDKRLLLAKSLIRSSDPPPAFELSRIAQPAYSATLADAEVAVAQSQLDARAEGVIGHLLFEGLAAAMSVLGPTSFSPNAAVIARMLREEGAAPAVLPVIATRLSAWFAEADQLAHVKFLFSPEHLEAANELSLSAKAASPGTDALRVDRTFVTAAGERWVVDFKFSGPPSSMSDRSEEWISAETERYRAQLRGYVHALRAWDESRGTVRPTVAALYFPWLDQLVRVEV
ncbi:MAG: UvrD-helicase domain-containing protein [Casimicrobium sp.]